MAQSSELVVPEFGLGDRTVQKIGTAIVVTIGLARGEIHKILDDSRLIESLVSTLRTLCLRGCGGEEED